MIPTERIRSYLNTPSPSYITGVNLFYDLSAKSGIRDSLVRYPNPDKLKSHLLKLLQSLQQTADMPESDPESKPLNKPIHKAEVSTSDPTLSKLEDERILLYKRLSEAHTLMRHAATDQERYRHMKTCVYLDTQTLDLRDQILFYKEYGRLRQRKSKPKDKKCTESEAHMKLRLEHLRKSTYTDRKLLEKLHAQIHTLTVIEEITALRERIEVVQGRLDEKVEERAMLERTLKESHERKSQ